MPHVIVKLWPGKSEEQKKRLAEAITRNVMDTLHYGEKSVSVAMEEITPADWWRRYTDLTSRISPKISIRSPDTTRVTCECTTNGRKRCKTVNDSRSF